MRSRIKYIVFGLLVVLIATNPSQRDFKEYLGADGYDGLKRTYNFFVCSVYERHSTNYFAIMGNFIATTKQVSKVDPFVEFGGHIIDSTAIADTSQLPHPPKKVDEYSAPLKDPLHLLEKRK